MKANPGFNASKAQMDGSPGTTALYLTTLWDDEADGAPKAWVKAFFGRSVLRLYDVTMLTVGQRKSASLILRDTRCLRPRGQDLILVLCLIGSRRWMLGAASPREKLGPHKPCMRGRSRLEVDHGHSYHPVVVQESKRVCNLSMR